MKNAMLLPLLLALGPAALAAQQTPDARWLPWLGCWQVGEFAEPGVPLVCVRPASDPLGVEIATVSGGDVVFARTLMADGQSHDLAVDDCTGSQVAGFSADGRRVYLRSAVICGGGDERTASGIMAMASRAVWLDAQFLGVDGDGIPRARYYYPAPAERWPEAFRFSGGLADLVTEARARAAGRLSLADVREAASYADPDAVATLVIELNQGFDLTAAALTELDDAAVPEAVIDAVVGVSYPRRFAVEHDDTRPVVPLGTPHDVAVYHDSHDRGGWNVGSCYASPYCDAYGFSTFGYGPRSDRPFGFTPTWSGGRWGFAMVVVRGAAAVGGRGYTRGGQPAGGTGRSAQPRGESAGGTGNATFSSSAGGGGGSSGGGSVSSSGYSRGGGGSSSSSGKASGTAKGKSR